MVMVVHSVLSRHDSNPGFHCVNKVLLMYKKLNQYFKAPRAHTSTVPCILFFLDSLDFLEHTGTRWRMNMRVISASTNQNSSVLLKYTPFDVCACVRKRKHEDGSLTILSWAHLWAYFMIGKMVVLGFVLKPWHVFARIDGNDSVIHNNIDIKMEIVDNRLTRTIRKINTKLNPKYEHFEWQDEFCFILMCFVFEL